MDAGLAALLGSLITGGSAYGTVITQSLNARAQRKHDAEEGDKQREAAANEARATRDAEAAERRAAREHEAAERRRAAAAELLPQRRASIAEWMERMQAARDEHAMLVDSPDPMAVENARNIASELWFNELRPYIDPSGPAGYLRDIDLIACDGHVHRDLSLEMGRLRTQWETDATG